MNPLMLMKIGKYISIGAVILTPIIWILLSYFDLLLVKIGFTLYTWLYVISWYAVVFVMIIRPLADIFPKQRWLRQLTMLRRAFGIVSAMVIVTLLIDKWIGNSSSFIAFFTPASWEWWYPLIARLSELTAIVLLLTSNNFSQKKLGKNWKRIQRSSYIYFITGGILAMRYGDTYGVKVTMVFAIVVFFIAMYLKYYRKRNKKKTIESL